MAAFLAGVGQGIGGAGAGGTAAGGLAGGIGAGVGADTAASGLASGLTAGAEPTLGATLGTGVGQTLGGLGRGYLGFPQAQGVGLPGQIGYGLGMLGQQGGGGQRPMGPQDIMGILRQLAPQPQGPATRILPQGPGQAQSRGLLSQLFAGI